jgi:SAM-dependent methyltransferase
MLKKYLVAWTQRFMTLRNRILVAWWLRGGYDPVRYWLARGGGYLNEFKRHDATTATALAQQEKMLLDMLQGLRFDSALELGCGFGRVLKIVADNFSLRRLEGIDVSPTQIAHAREYVGSPGIILNVADITKGLSYEDEEFDLVYTCEVLMHIPDPGPIMDEMLRVSRKYILNLEYFDSSNRPLGPWCFNHDLFKMYQAIPGLRVDVVGLPYGTQRIVLVAKQHY